MNRPTARDALISAAIGLLVTGAIAAVFRLTDLDLRLQSLVYRPNEPHWPCGARQPWLLLHDYGTWPGLVLTLIAIIALAISFTRESALRWRYPSLFIFLFMVLGPGLVTNLLGKALGGRPRPDEIIQFGGSLPFHRAFELGEPGKGFSFLCGHCSMGYLFFVFFFLCRGAKRWISLVAGALFGIVLGIGRVVQAAHFPSDILLDGALMFAVAAAISPIAALEPRRIALPHARWKVVAMTTAVAVLTICSFLFSTPVHRESSFVWTMEGAARSPATHQTMDRWRNETAISFAVQKGDVEVEVIPQPEPLLIETLVKGFGFPGAGVENTIHELRAHRILSFENRLKGLFWEVHGKFRLSVAENTNVRLLVKTGEGDVVLRARHLARPLMLSGSFALLDPSRTLVRAGNQYIRAGRGNPVVLSVQADRVMVR